MWKKVKGSLKGKKNKEENKEKKIEPAYGQQYPYEIDLVSFNTQYSGVSPYADTTVIRTPDMIVKGNLYSKSNRFRGEEFFIKL